MSLDLRIFNFGRTCNDGKDVDEYPSCDSLDKRSRQAYYSDSTQNLSAPLSIFNVPGTVATIGNLDPWVPPVPREPDLASFPAPTWEPPLLTSRHILRRPYAGITFRRLAHEIIDIASLQFELVQLATKEDVQKTRSNPSWEVDILSPLNQHGILRHTAPAALLNGVDTPSTAGMSLLVRAFSYRKRPPPQSFVHRFPVEIQDRILEYVSENPITAARLGCTLRLGTPFTWRRSEGYGKDEGSIQVQPHAEEWAETSPVESKIYFSKIKGTFCGLTYK
ncbi:uncharacterized protein PAC_00281 [Phialocephala subalpina]|uniref:Uncharacterized protein n=1 Tax=Phialocephala subalpina TaxID=576137 RepID=A0A1L7WCJ5_9HELO|nr:uncharacterized protein PAC_00281 [Phialocephala subalpina]